MGKPAWGNACAAWDEPIVSGREPGELKHLSTRRKRNDFPSSGERKGSSPNPRGESLLGVVGPGKWEFVEND